MMVPLVDIQNIVVIYGERPIDLIPELITNVETLVRLFISCFILELFMHITSQFLDCSYLLFHPFSEKQ